MGAERLQYCLDQAELALPEDGTIALFGPDPSDSFRFLEKSRCHVIDTMWTAQDIFSKRGFSTDVAPNGPYSAVILTLPRARALAKASIAMAVQHAPDGLIVVDGQKTDGIDSILKAVRSKTSIEGQVSKAHGRAFWFRASEVFSDWASEGATQNNDGFFTAPGVFSADGIDPASAILADMLPPKLGKSVVDLGGGWGYLTSRALANPAIENIACVEVDHTAVECARLNITDPRVEFHWADATTWRPATPVDSVLMNPPFHTGRKGDPGLGQAFIANAAKILKPSGHLWMVANRHLPYEATLEQYFVTHTDLGGGTKFKVLHAERPKRTRR